MSASAWMVCDPNNLGGGGGGHRSGWSNSAHTGLLPTPGNPRPAPHNHAILPPTDHATRTTSGPQNLATSAFAITTTILNRSSRRHSQGESITPPRLTTSTRSAQLKATVTTTHHHLHHHYHTHHHHHRSHAITTPTIINTQSIRIPLQYPSHHNISPPPFTTVSPRLPTLPT